MTNQEIFDKVVNHLRQQKCKAQVIIDGDMKCCYRTPEGLKCAAGCLINDELYSAELEHKTICSTIVMDALYKSGIDIHNCSINDLLYDLQQIHDWADVTAWEERFIDVAFCHYLKYTPPDK